MDSTDIAQEIEVPPCKKPKRASRRNTAKAASKVSKKKKETGKLLTKAERVKYCFLTKNNPPMSGITPDTNFLHGLGFSSKFFKLKCLEICTRRAILHDELCSSSIAPSNPKLQL